MSAEPAAAILLIAVPTAFKAAFLFQSSVATMKWGLMATATAGRRRPSAGARRRR